MHQRLQWHAIATAACFWIGAIPSAAGAQIIDTRTGSSSVNVSHPVLGQSFTAPAGAATLQQFSFWIAADGNLGTYDFQAFVMSWSGSEAIGAVLYSSGVQNAPACCTTTEVSFATGDISVVPGFQYVAFLHVYSSTIFNNLVQIGGVNADSYAGGTATFASGCAMDLSGCNWLALPTLDREFVATFDGVVGVPEPGSLALVVAGALGFMALRERRRRA